MHRIAMLGVIALSFTSAAMALADQGVDPDQNGYLRRYDLSCRFRGEMKGFENCVATARFFRVPREIEELVAAEDTPDQAGLPLGRLMVSCGDSPIYDDKATVTKAGGFYYVHPVGAETPAIKLPPGSIRSDSEYVVSAWLNLAEGQVQGFCEIESQRVQAN